MKYLKEFKEFIQRGNVIDLSVGMVIGSAFTSIVSSVVENFINPLVDGVSQLVGFESGLVLSLGVFSFGIGEIMNAVIQFFITAYCVFLIVKVVNKFFKKKEEEKKEVKKVEKDTTVVLLEEIRDLLNDIKK